MWCCTLSDYSRVNQRGFAASHFSFALEETKSCQGPHKNPERLRPAFSLSFSPSFFFFSFQNPAICLIVHLHRFNAFYMLFPPLFPGNKLYFLRKTSICRGRVGRQPAHLLPAGFAPVAPLQPPLNPPSSLPLLHLLFPFPPRLQRRGYVFVKLTPALIFSAGHTHMGGYPVEDAFILTC